MSSIFGKNVRCLRCGDEFKPITSGQGYCSDTCFALSRPNKGDPIGI